MIKKERIIEFFVETKNKFNKSEPGKRGKPQKQTSSEKRMTKIKNIGQIEENNQKEILSIILKLSGYFSRMIDERREMELRYAAFLGAIGEDVQKLLGYSRARDVKGVSDVLLHFNEQVSFAAQKLYQSDTSGLFDTIAFDLSEDIWEREKLLREARRILREADIKKNAGRIDIDFRRVVLSVLIVLTRYGAPIQSGDLDQLEADLTYALKTSGITPLYYDQLPEDDIHNRTLFVTTHPEAAEIPGFFIEKDGSRKRFGNYQGSRKRCE